MKSAGSVVAGVIIIIVEIFMLTSFINYDKPSSNTLLIIQFFIFLSVGGALISHGIKRER